MTNLTKIIQEVTDDVVGEALDDGAIYKEKGDYREVVGYMNHRTHTKEQLPKGLVKVLEGIEEWVEEKKIVDGTYNDIYVIDCIDLTTLLQNTIEELKKDV